MSDISDLEDNIEAAEACCEQNKTDLEELSLKLRLTQVFVGIIP